MPEIDNEARELGYECVKQLKPDTEILEVHNRAGLLRLADMVELDKYKPIPLRSESDINSLDYTQFKVVAGTFLVSIHHSGSNIDQCGGELRWLRDIIRARKIVLKWDGEDCLLKPEDLDRIVGNGFIECGWTPRASDMRMVIQFANNEIWSKTNIFCSIMHENIKNELDEISRLVSPLHSGYIPVVIPTFPREYLSYIQEHLKVKFTATELITWRNAMVDAIRKVSGTHI